MAHIREIMAAGVSAQLARMLGSNEIRTIAAAGSSQDDATPLISNFCLIDTSIGIAIRLGDASGAAITALFNLGPAPAAIYPAEDQAFNDLEADLPLALPAGLGMIAVPAIDCWLAIAAPPDGGLADAPFDGAIYGRRSGVWAAVPPPGTPAPSIWVTAGGPTTVPAGTGRAFVAAGAAVTLTLPPGDLLVMDRGPQAGTYTITVAPPAGATINGNPGFVITEDWGSATFIYDGVNYGVRL